MKILCFGLFIGFCLFSSLSAAYGADALGERITTVSKTIIPPYQNCELKDDLPHGGLDGEILYQTKEIIQSARVSCGADIYLESSISVNRFSCSPDNLKLAQINIEYSCLPAQQKIHGVGYIEKPAHSGTGLGDVDFLADKNAVEQCAGEVIRVSSYDFQKVYLGDIAKLTAKADYECVR